MQIHNNYSPSVLNRKEIQQFKKLLITSKLKESFTKTLYKIGIKSKIKFDLDTINIPDSKLSKLALEEANDLCNPILLYHSYRTFFWSAGIALSEKLHYDEELLFVSSMLHDVGLTDTHNHVCSKQCFANYGGSFANKFTMKNDSKDKASTIKTAIEMHLYPTVDKKKFGNEAYLLSKGAAMDVIGSHYFQVPTSFIKEVHKTYHRNGFKEDIIETMETLNHKENTRADILYKMGFASMASKNILDSKKFIF
ncbi:nitrile hydratase [Tenacibaculum mesophilum]|uniref:nitrile hydratase n=1 Tax=Tenacibaculum mesophilum TaxID=104268 RepID=UPI002493C638|nr:nitrile hydratase [Tenacibaculum mesophilum]